MRSRSLFLIAALLAAVVSLVVDAPRPIAHAQVPALGPIDIARDSNLFEYTRTFSTTVDDYDQDGDEDVFLVRHDPQAPGRAEPIPTSGLYRNDGDGTFTPVSFPGNTDRHQCVWANVDHKNGLDLFCAVGLTTNSVNELWIRQADGSYVNRAAAFNLTQNTKGRYRTATFIDVNDDGWEDIYVTRFYGANGDPLNPGDPEDPPYPNELWINQGGTSFAKDTTRGLSVGIGAQKDNKACNQAVDYDGDGDEDLLVCAQTSMILYRNDGTRFNGVAGALGIGGFWTDAEFADFNQDGLLDLAQVKGATVRIMIANDQGTFTNAFSHSITNGLNLAVGDFDGNTFLDVYVVGSCGNDKKIRYPDDKADLLISNGLTGFSAEVIPAVNPTGGCGDDVTSIDYNNDDRAEFLVVNGRRKEPGPVQLFTHAPDVIPEPDNDPPAILPPYNDFDLNDIAGIDGGVPITVTWSATDPSGVDYRLEKSSDGGQTFVNQRLMSGLTFSKTLLIPQGDGYQFQASATDGAGNPVAATGPLTIARSYQEDDFTYFGDWLAASPAGASQGGVMSANAAGSRATLGIPAGTHQVALISNRGPDGGKAEVYIDGTRFGRLDLYAASPQPRRIVFARGVNLNAHTLEVRVLGESNELSTGTRVDVDAFMTTTP